MAHKTFDNKRSLDNLEKELRQKGLIDEDSKKKGPKDVYYFDIGYNIAFNQIIYIMVFTYGLISPLILLIGCTYFSFKYFIDKYNLTVVYPKEYEGNG